MQIVTKEVNRLPKKEVVGTFMKCDECNMFVKVHESGFGGWDRDKDPIPLIAFNNRYHVEHSNTYDMTKWVCRRCYHGLP